MFGLFKYRSCLKIYLFFIIKNLYIIFLNLEMGKQLGDCDEPPVGTVGEFRRRRRDGKY